MISVENLCYAYPGAEEPSVNDISFTIEPGEIFGFLGPSGAGKSTTQKILYKLLSGYSGKAFIKNIDLKDWDNNLYKVLGVSFELPNHYLKLTALENLEFFHSFYDAKYRDPMELLDWVGLKESANKRVSEFSKGMKMRLNFVRSILHNPEVLFLDEPTSGLDPVNGRLIKDIIKKLRDEGKTIFITTHQMQDADELCDRIAFLVEGRIAILDTPSFLKQKYSHHTVSVGFEDGQFKKYALANLGHNEEFLESIRQRPIQTIHSNEASLDEIFIEVTGKSLV